MYRNQRIYQEACILWRELHGSPPPEAVLDGADLLRLALANAPLATYERLFDRQLRPANVILPRRAGGV